MGLTSDAFISIPSKYPLNAPYILSNLTTKEQNNTIITKNPSIKLIQSNNMNLQKNNNNANIMRIKKNLKKSYDLKSERMIIRSNKEIKNSRESSISSKKSNQTAKLMKTTFSNFQEELNLINSDNIDLEEEFNDIIEFFAEMLVLYNELFVFNKFPDVNNIKLFYESNYKTNRITHKQVPQPEYNNSKEHNSEMKTNKIKSNNNNDHHIEYKEDLPNDSYLKKLDSDKLISILKIFFQHSEEQKIEKIQQTLKISFNKEIKNFNLNINFFENGSKIFHGDLNNFQNEGIGHLIDIDNEFEYFGRIKIGQMQGKGKLYKNGIITEGHFEKGKVNGFGHKNFKNGSFYKYLI